MRSDVDAIDCLRRFVQTFAQPRQARAADALGISPQYVSDLLNGRRRFSDSILSKLGLRRTVVRKAAR